MQFEEEQRQAAIKAREEAKKQVSPLASRALGHSTQAAKATASASPAGESASATLQRRREAEAAQQQQLGTIAFM
jgi:hypothetical protein